MSDSGEKTEQPTPKKLQDVRKKGQGPQRKNVISAIAIAIGVMIIVGLVPIAIRELKEVTQVAIEGTHQEFERSILSVKDEILDVLIFVLTPIIAAMALITVFATLLLTRFLFSFENLKPKFEKFNPINGFKNIFSIDKVYEVGSNLFFFSFAGIILFFLIKIDFKNAIYSSFCGVSCVTTIFVGLIFKLVFSIVIYLLVLAGFDYIIQNVLFKRQQKMTKDEIKRESKESEGDPHVKGQRKQIAQEIVDSFGVKDITHLVVSQACVVGFRYDEEDCPNPFLITKVKGEAASALVRKIRSQSLPIVNLPAIANGLYKGAPTGSFIPSNFFEDIKLVLQKAQEQS